jgi:hypothetical protein
VILILALYDRGGSRTASPSHAPPPSPDAAIVVPDAAPSTMIELGSGSAPAIPAGSAKPPKPPKPPKTGSAKPPKTGSAKPQNTGSGSARDPYESR